MDYIAGMAVSYFKKRGLKERKFAAVMCSAVANVSLLGFFKYASFFIGNINRPADTSSKETGMKKFNLEDFLDWKQL